MKRSRLHFDLPDELIAQTPSQPRDGCRLMVLDKETGETQHKIFRDIIGDLNEGDVLVMNQSRVLPARLMGKKETGGKVEVLLLKELGAGKWECMTKGKVGVGSKVLFPEQLEADIVDRKEEVFILQFNQTGREFLQTIELVGKAPTPPYVKELLQDQELYQTVYSKVLGSAAAPTAGLHFTEELLQRIKEKGVSIEFVTLHVGLGTFQPITSDEVEDHPIHSEWFSIEQDVFNRIKSTKREGKRVIAVGTTSVRVLESVFSMEGFSSDSDSIYGETDIFIYPGYEFKAVDALITNFHTPYSSLLALVFALAGEENIKNAYKAAVNEKYRFFSFGDAMFIV